MPEPLTPMERRVYHYLIDFLADNTFQPSIREIARKFKIKSTKSVSDLLVSLTRKGYIERVEARSRGVKLLGYATSTLTQPVPLYTRVHPGEPPVRVDDRESFVTMDRRYLPSEDVFLLRMRGDSLTSRGIMDRDLVLVSPSARAKEGDLIATRSGTEAAFKVAGARDEPGALGVVCGVFRPFHERPPEADAMLRDEEPA
jgi:repressor LexA